MEIRLKKFESGSSSPSHETYYRGVEILKKDGNLSEVRWTTTSDQTLVDDDVDEQSFDVCIWMENKEIAVCCPDVEPSTSTDSDRSSEERASEVTKDVSGLQEEVIVWADRAKQAMKMVNQSENAPLLSLANTMNILSAYAKFSFLVDTFKSCGVIDVSLELLSNSTVSDSVKRHARDTLLTLSASDSQTNSYVLSVLTKEENHLSEDNREVLLDISQCMLNQIEARPITQQTSVALSSSVLSSLVKEFLKMNAFGANVVIANDSTTATTATALNANDVHPEKKHCFDLVFDFMKHFLELHGCFPTTTQYSPDDVSTNDRKEQQPTSASIFNGIMPTKPNSAKTKRRSDFKSDEEYAKYLQRILKPGMKVMVVTRSSHDYYSSRNTKEGTIGEFLGTVPQPKFKWENDQSSFRSPSASAARSDQVTWEQVELSQQQIQSPPDRVVTKKPRSFILTSYDPMVCDGTILTRNQWWEILYLLQKLPQSQVMDEVLSLTKAKSLAELTTLRPSVKDASPFIMLLKAHIPLSLWESLAIVQDIRLYNPSLFKQSFTAHQTNVSMATPPSIRLEAPYPDPYVLDGNISLKTVNEGDQESSNQKNTFASTKAIKDVSQENSNQDHLFSMYLKALETISLGRYSSYKKIAKHVRGIIKNNPGRCKVIVHATRGLLSFITNLQGEEYAECCEAEMFNLVLELMALEPRSCMLQTIGIKCFYFLMGRVNSDGLIPLLSTTVMSTIISLASSSKKSEIMKILVDGIECIANYYHLQLSEVQKKNISESIGYGNLILATLLNHGDFVELSEKYKEWGVANMIKSVIKCNVSFKFKKELCFFLSHCDTDDASIDWLIETLNFSTFPKQLSSVEDYHRFTRISHAKGKRFGLFVGMVTKYLTLLGVKTPLTDKFIGLPNETHKTFVDHGGVHCLLNIIMSSENEEVQRICCFLMGCLSMSIEVCEVLATQGGLDAIKSVLESNKLNEESVIDMCARMLFNMSQSENAFAVMVDWVPSLSVLLKTSFQKFKGKKPSKYLKVLLKSLSDHEDTPEVKTLKCARNSEIFSNICVGFVNVVFIDINNARRNNQMPEIPFIKKVFTVNCKKNIDGVDRIEASSGESQISHLTDGKSNTYWESSASSSISSHWIKLHMANAAIVKSLSIMFHERCFLDDITVKGIDGSGNQVELKKIPYPGDYTNSSSIGNPVTVVLEDLNDYYSEIKIILTSESGYRRVLIREISCDTISRTTPFEMLFTKFLIGTQFYYSVKCQVWINDLPLLQVFNKVTETLDYEQKLADYLGLSHSQQISLGKACKSCLIDKFLEIVSKNDDLIQLMQSYLLSVNVSESIINICSTITSLLSNLYHITDSHSFVFNQDCDMSEKIKLSATRRMCGFFIDCCLDTESNTNQPFFLQTWSKVIQLAYATFFKQMDFSCHPLIVITELFIFNEKVKQAAMELFNGHPLASIVTRTAIWNAVRSLDTNVNIQLCHCVCVSVHQLLLMEAIKSTEIMTVLSEIANSLSFLSMFELMYRKYLIERTLLNSKINVSLEWSVAKVFAECFPSAIPLSMIEDLMKSESCFDGFKQSCLHTFDQVLYKYQLNSGTSQCQDSKTAEISIDELMTSKLEFHVKILSPNLWPSSLSSIPVPSLELIHPLPTFVLNFNDYFATEGKNVTWTQYGRAQIQCNATSVLLNVSTVQMIIIMAFNDIKTKKVSFSELVERTGISPTNIRKALNALTIGDKANYGEPLLNVSADVKKAQLSSSTNEYYCINEDIFKKSLTSGRKNHEVSFNDTTTTSVPEVKADDLRIISRRRKDILQTQIVKLMKRERRLSTYELYASIKSVCSSMKFRHWFGNFECSYHDIHAEIDILVETGFVKRRPSNPLIIEYVVDGHQTVCLSSKPNDTTPSFFEPTNSIECDNIPLFQMPPIQDPNMQAIDEVIQADITTVACILNINSDLAECLLSDCSWDMEKLLNNYLEDEDYCKKQGFKTLDKSKFNNTDGCPICLNQQETSTFLPLWCGHVCCTECWYQYFQIESSSQTMAKCCCMYNDCFVKPTRKFVKKIVDKKPDGDLILAKFHESVSHTYIEHNRWLGFCKNPQGCNGVVTCTRHYSKQATCKTCSWNSCMSCNFIEAHDPASCEEIRRWVVAGGFHQGMTDEAKSAYLANKIAKQCPKCKMQIEKNEGCLHMVCKCGHHFCWNCLKNWSENHTNYFECKEVNATVTESWKLMEKSKICEKINESMVEAKNMWKKITAAGEGGRLPIKVFPMLHYAWLRLLECYKFQFYLRIVEFFNDSLESFSILYDDLTSKTTLLQNALDTFISKPHNNIFEKYSSKAEEFVCDTSKLLSLIHETLRKVLFAVKEGFRLCSHDQSSNSEIHSVESIVEIENTLLAECLKGNKDLEGQRDLLYAHTVRTLPVETSVVEFGLSGLQYARRGSPSPVYYDDDDDDDDYYYDDDYFGGYSS